MWILIAEDDPKLLKSLTRIFELNHYAVDGVDNGLDAFDFASSDEYDGLVLDIMMPGVDGVRASSKGLRSAVSIVCRFEATVQQGGWWRTDRPFLVAFQQTDNDYKNKKGLTAWSALHILTVYASKPK